MASSVVEAGSCQALVDFKFTVFPKIPGTAVAVGICTRVDTMSIYGAITRLRTIDHWVFTMESVKSYWALASVVKYTIQARAIVLTWTGHAFIYVYVTSLACKSRFADTEECIKLKSEKFNPLRYYKFDKL